MKLYRILGKRGRVTIPYEIRQRVGFGYNDVLSFTEQDDRTVIIRREKVCDDCREKENGALLQEFLDSLTADQQRAVMVHLSKKWAKERGGCDEDRNLSD